MRNKLWLGVAGGGILLAGLLLGALISGGLPALASFGVGNAPQASGTPNAYCTLYEQTLAKELGTTTAKLESANQAALKAVIQQAFKDGKITQAQETTLLNNLANNGNTPCALRGGFGFGGRGHGGPGGPGAGLGAIHQAVEAAVAGALKLQVTDLETQLNAGKTVAQIAQAQGVSIDTVNTAYLNAAKAELANEVTAKTITQAQSDQAYSMLQTAVAAGKYPGLERGGPRGQGPWGQPPAQATAAPGN
ncbi:MAG TPA: hypothetical protein VGR57_07400 [Ktedonobacterales bacterium]|nr:hypothetical protein [Ktedonobacterales bacterium]